MAEKRNFDETMARLEQITEALSREGVRLEDALALYEEGVRLVRECNETLEATERKIKMLRISQTGEIEEADLPDNNND